ncbi:hypothetical protein ACFQI7_31380 [Paenibacillus allorhizosphaerae]|uniref:DUF916 domain-containing protein n=1 Tax=Paenibacillus allorhizosphaerae TaxID=2849866 RepID=A0ABM8VQ47_9BACL|nr:hypothetical protein [Paenibacillus allorhizosphaerae]CAG7653671.1 hypothetical protein PAECIP111802_05556 [Paenibacillus allorhizosphaerae]
MDINNKDRFKRWVRLAALFTFLCGFYGAPGVARAESTAVSIAPDVVYTLEEAALSPGTESQTLRFRLQLTNEGSKPVDLNEYGVMVKDAGGQTYSAGLTEKKNARVFPGKSEDFAYLAELPVWLEAAQLNVMLFAWDYSQPTFMKEIGALPVAAAVSEGGSKRQKVYIEVDEIDNTLPDDAMASFEVARSMRIAKDGGWTLYIDLLVENLGLSSYKLPTTLQYILKDSNRLIYLAAPVSGGDATLLPREQTIITLSAAIPGDKNANELKLHFSKKNAADTIDYGSVALRGSAVLQSPGTSVPVQASGNRGLELRIVQASAVKTPEGSKLTARAELSNTGPMLEAVPGLTSQYQFAGSGISAAAVDNGVHPSFLAPGETTVYRFSAILPETWGENRIEMTIFNKKPAGSGTISIPAALFELKPEHIANGEPLPAGISYRLGDPVNLEPNNLLDERIELSLQSLYTHTNEDSGYRTAIAKWKVTNRGDTMLTLPLFQTELIGPAGKVYAGTRQNGTPASLLSNTSYVVSYSYMIPLSETGDSFVLHAVDDKTSPSNRLTLAAVRVQPQKEKQTNIVSLYPYQIEFQEHHYLWTYDKSDNEFGFKMRLLLNISKQEQVVVDAGFSKLQLELTDASNRVVATQTVPFVGVNKLVSGVQTINFSNLKTDQIESRMTVKVYEVIDTPNGQAKRLIQELK